MIFSLCFIPDYAEVLGSAERNEIQSDMWAPPSPDIGYFGSQESSTANSTSDGNSVDDPYEFLVNLISNTS